MRPLRPTTRTQFILARTSFLGLLALIGLLGESGLLGGRGAVAMAAPAPRASAAKPVTVTLVRWPYT